MALDPTLVLKNVKLTFAEGREPVLNGVDLALYPNEFVVLVGPNGSGKSSLLKTIEGQYGGQAAGEMFLTGRPYASLSKKDMAKSRVSLSQKSSDSLFFSLTVWENCLLYEERLRSRCFEMGKNKIKKQDYAAYLQTFHPQLHRYMDSPVKNLSGGEMQCLAMALCLKHPCDLLLLDEHTSAMSHQTAQALMEKMLSVLADRPTCVFMVTHNLSHALAFGSRLLVLQEGQVVGDYAGDEKKKLVVSDLIKLIS